ncbi:MAG: CopG family antitoxin [Rickettsiaceae bacterium]|nr:CopG family antitoxin [Rickettsiaceae bacterium]
MSKKTNKNRVLDEYEKDLEDNFEKLQSIDNLEERMLELKQAATEYIQRKSSITIRVNHRDLEAMRIKASKLGIPYQTYINMLIHKDAISGWGQ